ncbi:MAG: hypothetical protein EI684_19700 [Candidatus Viridilinea halotolerans]|uniref:Uncharacterized protein n=1 Tax=Candidatus Viridilinea halotolerans TaxID=2491704 RepID=A0A426TSI1_9CHLR|nr:MAG: hypothetical protein EI684_19700 [Candidatus Viridilinea halotolerans]
MNAQRIQQWIMEHDDSTLFNVLYIGLALVLSIAFGLFWLVAVVGVHAMLEVFRQYKRGGSWGFAITEMIWELKLDLALILFAFVLAIYLEYIFGLAGLAAGSRVAAQSAGRVTQASNRAIMWQRLIRGFFLSLDDIGLALRAVFARMRGKQPPVPAENAKLAAADATAVASDEPVQSSWRSSYSRGTKATLGFAGCCLALLLVAPPIIGSTYAEVLTVLREELRPLPE